MPNKKSISRSSHRGFTLVEMLVAMAVTLLLMAALSKAFGLIGENVRESRVAVDLTTQMRQVTSLIRDELSRATAYPKPPAKSDTGQGYLVYYEGPLSDATSTIIGQSPSTANENTYQDAKYGDYDDILAFTAVAKGDNWFRGKVPRFVLDAKTAELIGVAYNANNFPGTPLDPIVITSKYAEIIYFVAPEYQTKVDNADSTKRILEYGSDGNPLFVDDDANLIPDRLNLHRRVLLIRPDLNLSASGQLATHTFTSGTQSIQYMIPDRWPSDSVAATAEFPVIKTPATNGLSQSQNITAWLFGLSAIHQQCDLSVRRVNNPGGRPLPGVAANSLEDLTSPENRFAHVRVPSTSIGLATPASFVGYTSMPVLALGGMSPLMNRAVTNNYTGFNHAPPNNILPNLEGATTTVITPSSLNGLLRPEYILGMDFTHTDRADSWGDERIGEDLLATNILAFDLKGFDPSAQNFLVTGINGAPGADGVDDDGDGTTDEVDERGFAGTDDRIVTPNDAAYYEAIQNVGTGANADSVPGPQGAFVDLMYPIQAGGLIRGGGALRRDIHATTSRTALTATMSNRYFQTNLSGYAANASSSSLPAIYPESLFRSGKIISSGAGRILLFQPCYDTFTDAYEFDGFLQRDAATVGGSGYGTLWWLNNNDGSAPSVTIGGVSYVNFIDTAANGLDDFGTSTGVDNSVEKETQAPFTAQLSAIKVSIRVENSRTRQIRQSAITQRLD